MKGEIVVVRYTRNREKDLGGVMLYLRSEFGGPWTRC